MAIHSRSRNNATNIPLSFASTYIHVRCHEYLFKFISRSFRELQTFPFTPFSMVLESSIPSDLYNSTPPYVFPAHSKSMPSLRVPTNLVPSFSPFISMYTWTYPLYSRTNYLTRRNLIPLFNVRSIARFFFTSNTR